MANFALKSPQAAQFASFQKHSVLAAANASNAALSMPSASLIYLRVWPVRLLTDMDLMLLNYIDFLHLALAKFLVLLVKMVSVNQLH